MPNQPKTAPRTFRLGEDVIDQLDRLAAHLSARGGKWDRTEVIRHAVRRLAEEEGVGAEKNSRKK